jgi:hypothetical protein
VTLSLGLVYEERHHKLIAAVIVPSAGDNPSASNRVLDIKQDVHVVSVTKLTKAERGRVKKAFVVPSQQGFAVCFRRKDGGEDFLPIDEDSNVQAWQSVPTKSIYIVTYSDQGKFVRINNRKGGILNFIFSYIREQIIIKKR